MKTKSSTTIAGAIIATRFIWIGEEISMLTEILRKMGGVGMANLSGVKPVKERVMYEGNTYEKSEKYPVKGDIIRAESDGIDIDKGAYYSVTDTEDDDVYFFDNVGDLRGTTMRSFTTFKRVTDDGGRGTEYVEVDRAAKVGDRIRIVNAQHTSGKYNNGDEFIVTEDRYDDGDIYVDDVKAYGNLSGLIYRSEYVVLEPVESEGYFAINHVSVGDYVRITGKHTPNVGGAHGYDIGDVVKVSKVFDDSIGCVRESDGLYQNISPINFEVISEDKAVEWKKWARIGRKVGEIRKGDLVRVVNGCGGEKDGTIGTATRDGHTSRMSIDGGIDRKYVGVVELIAPVERRFDEVDG